MAHNYIGLAHLAVAPRRKTYTAFCLINFTKPAANGRAQKQWQGQQRTGEGGEKQTKFAAGHVNAIKTLPLCHAPSFARTPIYHRPKLLTDAVNVATAIAIALIAASVLINLMVISALTPGKRYLHGIRDASKWKIAIILNLAIKSLRLVSCDAINCGPNRSSVANIHLQ